MKSFTKWMKEKMNRIYNENKKKMKKKNRNAFASNKGCMTNDEPCMNTKFIAW